MQLSINWHAHQLFLGGRLQGQRGEDVISTKVENAHIRCMAIA
jgi:hypothetical protein